GHRNRVSRQAPGRPLGRGLFHSSGRVGRADNSPGSYLPSSHGRSPHAPPPAGGGFSCAARRGSPRVRGNGGFTRSCPTPGPRTPVPLPPPARGVRGTVPRAGGTTPRPRRPARTQGRQEDRPATRVPRLPPAAPHLTPCLTLAERNAPGRVRAAGGVF